VERQLEGDKRWAFGTPPAGNANYAWLQHILWHLKPTGQAGVVLANGSMSSGQSGEGDIRRRMVEGDVVECMVALPPQLFLNTQIPACLWFLTATKRHMAATVAERCCSSTPASWADGNAGASRVFRGRHCPDCRHRPPLAQDGKAEGAYEDVPGFCRSVKIEEIQEHDYVLTPGRYVGAEAVEDDDEVFAEKMERLTAQLAEQMAKGAELDAVIREKLGALGYGV